MPAAFPVCRAARPPCLPPVLTSKPKHAPDTWVWADAAPLPPAPSPPEGLAGCGGVPGSPVGSWEVAQNLPGIGNFHSHSLSDGELNLPILEEATTKRPQSLPQSMHRALKRKATSACDTFLVFCFSPCVPLGGRVYLSGTLDVIGNCLVHMFFFHCRACLSPS